MVRINKKNYSMIKLLLLTFLCNLNFNYGSATSSTKKSEEITTEMNTGIWPNIKGCFLDILVKKKNVLAGKALQMAATAVDKLCSSVLYFTRVPEKITPNISKIHFQYMTPCRNYSVPLLEVDKLWVHSNFNNKNKVVILATGWTNTVNSSTTIATMWRAFMCRPEVNFMIVDVADYVDTLYKWSALNTDPIGEKIALGLTRLTKLTPLDNIHLIGHSLGAHIMGTAGRVFKNLTGRLIPRITGLDPAKPCFHQTKTLSGLFRGDAEFVDIIHTNIGVLAKQEPLGDIDFYPGGANPLQPGCLTIGCSHSRAVEYFAESVYPSQQNNFKALECDSWQSLERQNCATNPKTNAFMGYLVNVSQRGIFYVKVNRASPYGSRSVRLTGKESSCSICPS